MLSRVKKNKLLIQLICVTNNEHLPNQKTNIIFNNKSSIISINNLLFFFSVMNSESLC